MGSGKTCLGGGPCGGLGAEYLVKYPLSKFHGGPKMCSFCGPCYLSSKDLDGALIASGQDGNANPTFAANNESDAS